MGELMSNLVHNERMKLRAAFFNAMGVAIFITCIVVPAIGATKATYWLVVKWALFGGVSGFLFHLFAIWWLGKLRE